MKQVRALHRKAARDEQGLFLVQGRKLVKELLRSDWKVRAVHATEEAAHELGWGAAHVHPAHVLERMGTLENGNEVVAVVHKRADAGMVPDAVKGLVLALDGITDPGNLGTVLRIADWFGAHAVWCAEGSVDVYNPKCVQASMGSVFRVPVAYGALAPVLGLAVKHGATVYKADMAGTDVFGAKLDRPAILVLGSESHGLSEAVRNGPGTLLAIPSFGGAESLNVATAAAALCMEFARQARG